MVDWNIDVFQKAQGVRVAARATDPVDPPRRLANGLPVQLVRLEQNLGAAGRNAGAQVANGPWLIMLDDDSWPLDTGFIAALDGLPEDVAAVGGHIRLPDGRSPPSYQTIFNAGRPLSSGKSNSILEDSG